MTRFVLFLVCVAATACAARAITCVQAAPTVIEVPYTAVFELDTTDTLNRRTNGRTGCDLNGEPFMVLRNSLRGLKRARTVYHEQVHIHQMRTRGCFAFVKDYEEDQQYRVRIEGEAYCAVYALQSILRETPDPSFPSIIAALEQNYSLDSAWTADSIRKTIPCVP
jgi:hypothetical protein